MFEDVKELYLGAALKLQTRLREAAAAVVWPQYGSSYPSRPPQAHISPSWCESVRRKLFLFIYTM